MILQMSESDAYTATEAIANKRFYCRCECDFDVGYGCDQCKRMNEKSKDDSEYVPRLISRYGEMLFHQMKVNP